MMMHQDVAFILWLPGSSKVLCGDKAFDKRSKLDIACPIQRGLIINWDNMEKVSPASLIKDNRAIVSGPASLVLARLLSAIGKFQKIKIL